MISLLRYRPEWDKCAKYIEGGEERWKEISKDKSSDELMNTLLAEMTGQDIAIIKAGAGAANEFFTGMVRNISLMLLARSLPYVYVYHVSS